MLALTIACCTSHMPVERLPTSPDDQVARADLAAGRTALGIELGSTRIKACLIGSRHEVLATGGCGWENELRDGHWTYSLEAAWSGLRQAVGELLGSVESSYGVRPVVGALG